MRKKRFIIGSLISIAVITVVVLMYFIVLSPGNNLMTIIVLVGFTLVCVIIALIKAYHDYVR